MGLFTSMENKELTEARKQVVPGERVCPGCKQSFTTDGTTLTMFNAALGIEGHTCPRCGHVLSMRRPSPDGL